MKRKKSKAVEMEMDLTPMIDVVFNLLIFFLCSPFKIPEGQLDAFLPKDQGPSSEKMEKPPEKVVVGLRGQGIPAIYVGRRPLGWKNDSEPDWDELAGTLARMEESNGEEKLPVEIDSDKGVSYKYVVGVLNACTMARIEDIRFTLPTVSQE